MTAPDDYAIVVGIDEYSEPPGALSGAKQDALAFLTWLKSDKGGRLPASNVDPFVELSDANRTKPTFSHLLKLLVQLRKKAPAGKKRIGRRLYIFLAGHGVAPPFELDETGLVTVEAEDQLMPCLPGKQSADGFVLTGRFDEVVLFMDCCRVTDLLLKPNVIPTVEKPDLKAAAKAKRFYVYATAFGRPAREVPYNGVTRGIFSRVLMDGLNGGATTDAQGRLTTTQLRAYLESEMKQIKIDGEEQVPGFASTDEIVLVDGLLAGEVLVNVTYSRPIADVAVLDGANDLAPASVKEHVVTAAGRRFSVPAGRTYQLKALGPGGVDLGLSVNVKAERAQVDVVL